MRLSRRTVAAVAALLFVAACSDLTTPVEPVATDAANAPSPRQGPEIPARSEERPGTFIQLEDAELWDLIEAGGRVAVVGLRQPGVARGVYGGRILIGPAQLSQARSAVANSPGVSVVSWDDLLPLGEVRIESRRALAQLRRLPIIDYVEPTVVAGPLPWWASTGGCGWPGAWTGDWITAPSSDGYSARYEGMRIPQAWAAGANGQPVSGAGVTIGLTDTGVSTAQAELRQGFAGGTVPSRWVRHFYVSGFSSADDACGHGTRMAGVIAAPDDGRGVLGVAWGANLVNVRQADGVANVSTSAARSSVRAAAQNGSRIVAMAWQSMNWFWQLSDEISYWHSRGVLFLAAAGTSGCGDLIPDNNVVFPAEMSQVVAVTGISYPTGGVPCGIHYGSQVELTAYLDVPTTGRLTGDVTSIGGSSNATAIVAGIAALAWQANPSLTRDQLRRRLQESGSNHPYRHAREGFGLVNAHRAVTGAM